MGDEIKMLPSLACIYYHYCQPCLGSRYLLASTAAITQTGIDVDGIWALSLDGKPRKLLVDLRKAGVPPSTKAVIFKQVDSRTVSVLHSTFLQFLNIPLAGKLNKPASPQAEASHPPNRITKKIANLRRPADHFFQTGENSLNKVKLFAEKTDLGSVMGRGSMVAVPNPSQISFFNLKSRKLIKTRRFLVRCDLLRCLNVYPDKSGSGMILIVLCTGGPKPSPHLDIRLFDPRRDLEADLLGPDAYVGDVPDPSRFKDSIYCDALYNKEFAVISQIFFLGNQFAHPHITNKNNATTNITIIRFQYHDVGSEETTASGDKKAGDWVSKQSTNCYLIPGASLFIQLLGLSDDGSRVLCTDMTQKRFWISIADGTNHGYH